jgi:hypothetical protein
MTLPPPRPVKNHWELAVLLGDINAATKLPSRARLMLAASAEYVTLADGRLWPGVEKWASRAGLSRRSGHEGIRDLIEAGILAVVNASAGGAGNTSTYRLTHIENRATGGRIGNSELCRNAPRTVQTQDKNTPPVAHEHQRTEENTRVRNFVPRDPTDQDLVVASGRAHQ